ncbi:hypothetical protein H9Q72_001667 [Fusarium xylarioides]|uniref:Uncharacterized protein n=1 Tax=Fusarium xylarioides TaxID=221167 RepID=A0A9P7I7V0_9HYPO|nr:hypothetical protein H9Q72_001667 [Fusarium xylarioides]
MLPGTVSYHLKLLISALFATLASGYSDQACCNRAREENAFVFHNNGSTTPTNNIVCGQIYNESSPAAPDANVTYKFCKSECGGWGVSSIENADQWAGPIVQFILPSVIFSMNIPRTFEFVSSQWLEKSSWLETGRVVAVGDISGIVVSEEISLVPMGNSLAGNNVAGESEPNNGDEDFDGLREKVELLVIVLAGRRRFNAMTSIPTQTLSDLYLPDGSHIQPDDEVNQNYPSLSEQLKRLVTSQSAFGAIVGAAVVFYLGAFIYTILDLLGDKSNQDAAISLAFGVEWMIIVHVAIVNGFLLASNNPSPVTMLIGRPLSTRKPIKRQLFPPIYDGILQPVFMWRRGVNKMEWLEKSRAWQRGDQRFMNDVRIKKRDFLGWIVLPTIILISLPPAAGAVVAWQTPPRDGAYSVILRYHT